jgi:hypothetical protein
MITFRNGCAIATFALALPMAAMSSSQAAPLAPSQSLAAAHVGTDNSLVTEVQWRRRGGYGYRRGWGGGGAGLGIGLAAGALIGGAIAAGSSPYYYGPGYYGGPAYYPAPAPVYGGDAVAYCMQRYRSYDPASGTYLNYDGNRYPCP